MDLDGSPYRIIGHIIDNWRVYLNHSLDHLEPWQIVLYTLSWVFFVQWLRKTIRYDDDYSLVKSFNSLLLNIPVVQKKYDEYKDAMVKELDDKMLKQDTVKDFYKFLPDRGLSVPDIIAEATEYKLMSDLLFERRRLSGSSFIETDESHLALLVEVFKQYCFSNASYPDIYPGCRKMEAEIVRILCSLYHGGQKSGGAFTTSSTESILLVCTAYRNKAYKSGIRRPEIIVGENVNIGFLEAEKLLGVTIMRVPLTPDRTVDIGAIKRAISRETCLIVVGAPSPVSGTVDNIEEISQLALHYEVAVHVDASYGGFLLPFMEQCDFPCPPFDFRVPGVMSITVDLDKYAYCPVGSSAVLYRDTDILEYQCFSRLDWLGGIYVNSTLTDNRSGALIALSWATILFHGRHGYVERTQQILDTARYLVTKLKSDFDGMIEVLGDPVASVVVFSTTPNSHVAAHWLGEELNELGWNLSLLQNPESLRICISLNQTKDGVIDEFLDDINKCCSKIIKIANNGDATPRGKTVGVHGLSSPLTDYGLSELIPKAYIDMYYSTPAPINRQTRTLSIEGRKISQIVSRQQSRLGSISLSTNNLAPQTLSEED